MKARIEIDFARPSLVSVDAMQCDTLTRELEVQMLQDGEEYDPTDDFTSAYGFSVDYVKKANGIRGRYEKMPDETTDAVTQTGTKLLVRIAPAVLTAAGRVILNIRIYKNSTGETLRSFPIVLNVIPAAVGDGQPDEDYWNIKSLADVTAALNDCVAYSSQTGKTEAQKAQARANIGAMEDTSDPTFSIVHAQNFIVEDDGDEVSIGLMSRNKVAFSGANGEKVKLTNLETPAANDDAANKAYVDAQIDEIDIETDVSDAYAAAAQQDPTLTPLAYLAALPAGRYKMYAEASNYRAENIPIADSSTYVTSEIKEVTDEGFSYRYVYNDGRREVAVIEEGGTYYDTPLSARSPSRDIDVVTRGFLVEKLADPFTKTTEYAAKDYCTYDGNLYRAKQDIAAGSAWNAALWDEVTVGGELEEKNQQQKDILGNIAADYDSTKTYSAGTYCIKDAKLYRCVTPIPTPEAWTAAHWEEVTVGQALQENKEYIDAVASTLKFETWGDLQKIVRAGLADKVLAVGDQLICERAGVELTWDVLGIDIDTPADSQFSHTVTLGLHDCFSELQFDAREALFYCEEGLAAGTYNFTVKQHTWVASDVNKTFQFTLTEAVPAKGQIVLMTTYNVAIAGRTVKTFASASSTTEIETATVTEGSVGTSLGDVNNTIAGGTNSLQRALTGNNNYAQSAIRQYLNSKATAGSVWSPQNVWDRAPTWAASTEGFLNGIDEDFLSVIGEVTKKTALNTVSDGGGSATTTEKVFLLSRSEVYGGNEVTGGEGAAYPYYAEYSDLGSAETGNDSNRIKCRNGTATYWWLRSPYAGSANSVRLVYAPGNISGSNANNSIGVAPACCIV